MEQGNRTEEYKSDFDKYFSKFQEYDEVNRLDQYVEYR